MVFQQLGIRQRTALLEREETQAERVSRIRDGFLAAGQPRSMLQLLFEQIGHLDDSQKSEVIRSEMRRLERTHDLRIDPSEAATEYDLVLTELGRLSYLERHASAETRVLDVVEESERKGGAARRDDE